MVKYTCWFFAACLHQFQGLVVAHGLQGEPEVRRVPVLLCGLHEVQLHEALPGQLVPPGVKGLWCQARAEDKQTDMVEENQMWHQQLHFETAWTGQRRQEYNMEREKGMKYIIRPQV